MVSEQQQGVVKAVLEAADEWLPTSLSFSEPAFGQGLGVAATRHAANLLGAELHLATGGYWSLTRVLGRSVTEAWLWANLLFLGGEPEVQSLADEHANRQHGLAKGAAVIWDELESAKADGIDLRKLVTVPEGTYRQPNISDLAHSVARLREEHHCGRGVALVAYEAIYRTESNSDVHISFELLARYLAEFTTSGATVLRQPGPDDINDLRGPLSLHHDCLMVADAIGLYLLATGREDDLERVKATLNDIVVADELREAL